MTCHLGEIRRDSKKAVQSVVEDHISVDQTFEGSTPDDSGFRSKDHSCLCEYATAADRRVEDILTVTVGNRVDAIVDKAARSGLCSELETYVCTALSRPG